MKPVAWNSRRTGLVEVHPGAHVSHLAAIGLAGEYRGRESRYVARVDREATISEFARVQAGVERETFVGRNAFIMAGAHIGHDAIIGENADICPNAVICGFAEIGPNAKIYSNATVSPFVKVGASAIIAGNSCVTKDVPAGELWGGAPAKFIKMRDGWTAAEPREVGV